MKPHALPLFVVKPDSMTQKDIRRAERLCGVCIVECKEPEAARYLEAPLDAQMDLQARAAMGLVRIIAKTDQNTTFWKHDLQKWFINAILENQPLAVPTVKAVKR